MFGFCYIDDFARKECYEWFNTKEEAIEAAVSRKCYCLVADRITDEEWLEGWITFFIGYTYDEIKELF